MLTPERLVLRTARSADASRNSGRAAQRKSIPNEYKAQDFQLSRSDSFQIRASDACDVTIFLVTTNEVVRFRNFLGSTTVWTLAREGAEQRAVVPSQG